MRIGAHKFYIFLYTVAANLTVHNWTVHESPWVFIVDIFECALIATNFVINSYWFYVLNYYQVYACVQFDISYGTGSGRPAVRRQIIVSFIYFIQLFIWIRHKGHCLLLIPIYYSSCSTVLFRVLLWIIIYLFAIIEIS